jgi:hypothetical protein
MRVWGGSHRSFPRPPYRGGAMPFSKRAPTVVMMLCSYADWGLSLLGKDLRCMVTTYRRLVEYAAQKSHYRSHLARSGSCVCVGTPPYKGGGGNSHA